MSEITENQTIKHKLFEELKEKREDVFNLEGSILRKYGWDQRCDFPDHCWRWVKSIKGVTLVTDAKTALDMEYAIIEYS